MSRLALSEVTPMAFTTGVKRNTAAAENDSWKAQAFINLYLPTENGGKRKLISIPLKDAKAYDSALIERMQQDGSIEALKDALIIDFQLADKEVKSVGF